MLDIYTFGVKCTMNYLELFATLVLAYWLIYIILWIILDCNVALWFKIGIGRNIKTLRGKVVWITGASSGIGKGLALNLARRGVKLVLSARRENLLEEVKSQCLAESRGLLAVDDVLVLPMDMLNLENHHRCLLRVLSEFGNLDILVNNAGRSQRANWEDIDVQVDRDLFELDVFSLLHLTRIVVRYFKEHTKGKGHLAATSSVAGMTTVPYSASYCGAKHALNAYLQCLAVEHQSLDVTIFNPGPVATDFLQEAFTANPNSRVGSSITSQNRLTVERCGFLFATALANKMEFVWCGLYPINFLAYASRYPLLRFILRKCMTKKTLSRIREGRN